MKSGRTGRTARRNRLIRMLLLLVCALGAVLLASGRVLAERIEEQPQPQQDSAVLQTLEQSQPLEPDEPVIVLDAGHGGKDPGCTGQGRDEKDITLKIVLEAARLLREEGYTVTLTREDDSFVSLEDRVSLAEESGAALFVSVHLNALDGDTVTHGIDTYCNSAANAESPTLANAVQRAVVEATGGKDREVHTDSEFYVVHHTSMPSCLLEAGFLTADEEGALLLSDEYQAKIAAGVVSGISAFLEDT